MAVLGRPTLYSDELIKEICMKIACTPRGLSYLCRVNAHWPCRDTIYAWKRENKIFSDMYIQAKRDQVECMVDDIIEIAHDSSQDYVEDKDGNLKFNSEHVQRSRLIIDTLKWNAAKQSPRLYGNKLTIESSNEEQDAIDKAKEIVNAMKGENNL